VRDEKSQETLKNLSLESTILPDPVLNYEGQKIENSKIIGIALRK
jgi:hypothetical protein